MNRLWVRIFAAHLVVLALVAGVGAAAVPRLVRGYFYHEAEAAMAGEARQVARLITEQIVDWRREVAVRERTWVFVRRLVQSDFHVFSAAGELIASKLPATPSFPAPWPVARAIAENRTVAAVLELPDDQRGAPRARHGPPGREGTVSAAALAVPLQRDGRVLGVLLMFRPAAAADEAARRVLGLFGRVALAGVAAALLGSLWVARTLTRPLRELQGAARSIAGGDLTTRAGVPPGDEVGDLARAFNQMANRVEAAIGELRAQEAQRREFMAAVSHELRTPLTSVRGFVAALRDRINPDPDAQRRYLAIVDAETGRMERLVEDLFQFAKLEAGQLSLRREPIALGPFLADFNAKCAARAEQARVRWEVDVDPDIGVVLADRDRLSQVLFNLVDNALRHTPGGGAAGLSAKTTPQRAEITVWDTGPGIPADELPHIFERFYQGKGERRPAGGMGLGLAIARGLAQRHGGDIEVDSSPAGARFTLWLPLAPAPYPSDA